MLSVDHPTEWELFRDTLDKMNHHGAFSCLRRVYILKGLKRCGIVLIKIHLRDEITTSERCEGFEDCPLESHKVFCHPALNMALSL